VKIVPDNSVEIGELREILNTGVTRTSNDGHSTEFSEAWIRRRLDELIAEDDTGNYDSMVRPKALKIKLR